MAAADPRQTTQRQQQPRQQQRQPEPPQRHQIVRTMLRKGEMASVVSQLLGKSADPSRWTRVFINALESSDQDLLACTDGSIARALIHSAEVQLEVGGPYPHAYLIPYNNTKQNTVELQFQISVWGYTELVRRAGVRKVWADVVYESDEYECVSGTAGKQIIHKPCWFDARKDRGNLLGSYACAILANGETVFEPVSWEELEQARRANRGKSPAWDTWPEQQYQKVALKRLSKYLPKGDLPERAMAIDEDPSTRPFIDVPGISVDDVISQPATASGAAQDALNTAVAAGKAQAAQAHLTPATVDRGRLFQRLCDADERWLPLRGKVNAWTEGEALEVLSFLRVILDGDGFGPGDVPPEQPSCMRIEEPAA